MLMNTDSNDAPLWIYRLQLLYSLNCRVQDVMEMIESETEFVAKSS